MDINCGAKRVLSFTEYILVTLKVNDEIMMMIENTINMMRSLR